VTRKFLLRLVNFVSAALLAVSLAAFHIYGNYLKIHRSYAAFGRFKYSCYLMGRPIYLSACDYIFLAWIGGGIVLGVVALFYFDKKRWD
jgi:hypothetical protein